MRTAQSTPRGSVLLNDINRIDQRENYMKSRLLTALLTLFMVPFVADAQWNIMLTSDTMHYTGVSVVNRSTAWMIGHSGDNSSIRFTPDGGLQWGGGVFEGRQLVDIEAVDGRTIWMVGRQVDCDCASITIGLNGGAEWNSFFYQEIPQFTDVEFYGSSLGMIAGHERTILVTRNGGTTWSAATVAEEVDVIGIDISSSERAYALARRTGIEGATTLLYVSTDRGEGWDLIDEGEGYDLTDISFSNTMQGYTVGESNGPVVRMTSDGGFTWREAFRPAGGPETLLSVTTSGSDTVYVGGDDGSIYASYDRGATWIKDRTLFDVPVYALAITDGVGWGTGPSGSFYKTVKAVGPDGYCLPPVTGPVYGSGILAVSLDASPPIARPSRSDEYYTFVDPVETMTPRIVRGATHTVTMITDPANIDGRNSSRVWIDFNRDGDFDDDGEDVAFWDLHDPATEQIWKFQVPGDAERGETVMRVYTDMPGEFGHDTPNPCGYKVSDNILGQHGEVEDYAIEIVDEISSVDERDAEESITVVGDRIELSGVESGGMLRVVDLLGRVAAIQTIGAGSTILELPNLPHGTWLLDFTLDGERRLRRVER